MSVRRSGRSVASSFGLCPLTRQSPTYHRAECMFVAMFDERRVRRSTHRSNAPSRSRACGPADLQLPPPAQSRDRWVMGFRPSRSGLHFGPGWRCKELWEILVGRGYDRHRLQPVHAVKWRFVLTRRGRLDATSAAFARRSTDWSTSPPSGPRKRSYASGSFAALRYRWSAPADKSVIAWMRRTMKVTNSRSFRDSGCPTRYASHFGIALKPIML